MRYFLTFCIGVMGVCGHATLVHAATISLSSESASFRVGDEVTVTVQVDTEREAINAVESHVNYPTDMLEYVRSNDGNSVVSLWVERPALTTVGTVHFSGVVPGGFVDVTAPVLTVVFKVCKPGTAEIVLSETQLLKHDGAGTPAMVREQNLNLTLEAGESSSIELEKDVELPEHFVPTLVVDPDVFAGKASLVFATQDKGSGLSRFEIKEGWWGRYAPATSPYEIKHQALNTAVYIKAVDMQGNERVEIFYPHNWQPWHKDVRNIATIVVLCVLMVLGVGMWRGRFWRLSL